MKRLNQPILVLGQESELDNFTTNNGALFYAEDTGTLHIKGGTNDYTISGGGGALLNEVTGLPVTDSTASAYRTGPMGIGEIAPEELLDIVGSETVGTGGFKYQYTWDSGAISRVQFGGQNVLSELGVPANLIEANLFDWFGIGAQAGYRSFLYNGNVSAVSAAAGKMSVGVGIQSLAPGQLASFSVFPDDLDVSTDFMTRIATSRTGDGYAYVQQATKTIANVRFDTEPSVELRVAGTPGGGLARHWFTPYYASFDKGFELTNYGAGTYVQGFAHADQDATTIGVTTRALGVDAGGQVKEIDGFFGGSVAPASATASGKAGERRVVGDFVYKCDADNVWTRASLTFATW